MSLFINDELVTGIYAFNQWFEVERGTIEIDIFDLTYATRDDKSFYYNMGVFYPELENGGQTRYMHPHITSAPTYCKMREFTRDTGISFFEAGSERRISFSLSEVKAFREEFADDEDKSDPEE